MARSRLTSQRKHSGEPGAMPEPAEEIIVHNLIDALDRLRDDVNKVELWAGALGHFQHPVPDYQAGSAYVLPSTEAPPRPR